MGKTKILFIDDEKNLCHAVKLNLEETGRYDVRTETKGTVGLTAAKEFMPNLIILDFRMPDMHGADVALEIQNDRQTGDIPIIFLTGMATKDDLEAHGDAELCDFVIAKPATTEEIVDCIERHLGKRTNLTFLGRLFNSRKEIKWKK